ncbi:MAG: UDP-N-acetylglucosamine 2-epimerase (non-hydrolyzing) [Burkholderiales bacterium]|nr:UDP-N-acetylglucosamine 2-epimerase (non-hydrolyzing) [Burkholderiales bacterium]
MTKPQEQAKIVCVVGTRPEAVKMAPVILALQREPWAQVRVLATGQHRQMLDQVLQAFGITADIDLDMMQPNQDLTSLTARMLTAMDRVLKVEQPSAVLAQGDTTTVMVAALASFYLHIPFGHVEAGLRTGDLRRPFPEEMNRVMAGRLAQWHFAPTESARQNLAREGITDEVYVTGNTVIDALQQVAAHTPASEAHEGRRLVLVTMHRRESFGGPLEEACNAIRTLVDAYPDVEVLYPVHRNPNVLGPVEKLLGGHPRIRLVEPLDYVPFVAAMKSAYLVLTDSGGVQEEAPALAKPVLVMREETERPEAVAAGVVQLVGTDAQKIVGAARRLLDDPAAYRAMAKGVSPYGDGKAAGRIVDVLRRYAGH